MTDTDRTTWDGKPIDPEPPFGASIIVYRQNGAGYQFLILHRAHNGPDFAGDWAWTPPSGARHPGEPIAQCASRELQEETGLQLPLQATPFGENWAIFFAEAQVDGVINLVDDEHDHYEWVSLDEAVQRCQPAQVNGAIRQVAGLIGLHK